MSELIELQVERLGVPLDNRFGGEVRARARKLALKRPDFYKVENGGILWVSTVADDVFKPVYDWVLYGSGTEPE